jgi:hypothetical protein
MNYGPIARIFLRYIASFLIGAELGEKLASDSDVVLVVGIAIAAAVEVAYGAAKKRGWAT